MNPDTLALSLARKQGVIMPWKMTRTRSVMLVALTLVATIVTCLTIRINILAMMTMEQRSKYDDPADFVGINDGFRRTLERSVVASSSGTVVAATSTSDSTDADETKANRDGEKTDALSSWVGFRKRRRRYTFPEQWTCDAQDEPDLLPEGDVTRRGLHAVIIGAQKGGTQALLKAILTHGRMMNAGREHGELHLLNTKGLLSNLRGFKYMPDKGSGIIRRRHLRMGFEWLLKNRDFDTRYDISADFNARKLGIHSAPVYLFSGRSVPARLMCVAPWSRVIAILRNPIDRAFSHFNYMHNDIVKYGTELFNGTRFEDVVYGDIGVLRRTGVLRDWEGDADFESFSGSEEESRAWEKYLEYWVRSGRNPGIWGPVGRGLYAIQLGIWIDEMNKINTTDNLLVLESEDFKEDGVNIYHRVAQFLGLGRQSVSHIVGKKHHETEYVHDGMSEEIYTTLYELYRPYNKRLYKLLGKLGEDDWDGVWDKPSDIGRGLG